MLQVPAAALAGPARPPVGQRCLALASPEPPSPARERLSGSGGAGDGRRTGDDARRPTSHAERAAADTRVEHAQRQVRDQVADHDRRADTTTTMPRSTGRSRRCSDVIVSIPMPGIRKARSTKIAPAKARPTSIPTMATIGSTALRNVWRRSVPHSESPFARAVRT